MTGLAEVIVNSEEKLHMICSRLYRWDWFFRNMYQVEHHAKIRKSFNRHLKMLTICMIHLGIAKSTNKNCMFYLIMKKKPPDFRLLY